MVPPDAFARLDEAGLLAPVDADTLARVPAGDSATDKNWVGVSARLSMVVYNTDDLKPSELPTSIYDLADQVMLCYLHHPEIPASCAVSYTGGSDQKVSVGLLVRPMTSAPMVATGVRREMRKSSNGSVAPLQLTWPRSRSYRRPTSR